ncbi:MAG: hypothetical protein ACK5Q5_16900 [Planctomycetaceae bacterium]
MHLPPLMIASISSYIRFYKNYAARRWDGMTPMEYGILLITIGVIGFVMMRNASRK